MILFLTSLAQMLRQKLDHLFDAGRVGRVEHFHHIDGALAEHRAFVREGLEAEEAVVVAHPAHAHAAEGEVGVGQMDGQAVHAAAAGGCIFQDFLHVGFVVRENIKGQRLFF